MERLRRWFARWPARLPARWFAITVLALAALPYLAFRLLDLAFPFPWEALQRPAAVVVTDREGEPLRFFLPGDGRWRLPVRLADLPPELPRALVAAEDRRFYRHGGVDGRAVLRAAWSNLRAGRVVSGASTIPMQIARMAQPGPRTLGAKLRESFRALQLTRRHGKPELLEVYVNLLPYGGNLEGVGAAAWFYFGKTPDRLSLGEIALLTALPRAPVRYDPTRNPEAARAARDRLLDRLAELGVFPAGEIENGRRQPVPAERRQPPFAAPHWSELVAARGGRGMSWSRSLAVAGRLPPSASVASIAGPAAGDTGAAGARGLRGPLWGQLRSTLDRRLQQSAEEQVARRTPELLHEGIGNAAVVVIGNRARAVRAMVGSSRFFDRAHQGQVNGAVARRSPGSTLKPFLYALAIDQGRVLSDSWLLDVPTDFSGYVADNYDERYRGRVTVRQALIESLNACAVRLAADMGLADFHRLLLRGGLATLDRPTGEYGLPLILGAGEVTLLDLTNLYASLADEGRLRPVRLLEEDGGHGDGERLVSPEAAQAITEILTDVRRPDLPDAWELTRDVPRVAWKTGTSYGHRDAWAIGWSGRYTIGVWVGNFDGRPVQGISGSRHAGPLLFDLFRAADPGGAGPARSPGLRLEPIELCAESRELPGTHCPARVRGTYIPGRSRLAACSYHRRVLVDAGSGELLSGDCVGARRTELRVLTAYPPALASWWRSQGQPVPEAPPLAAGCHGVPAGERPRIVSPDPATAYRVRRDAPPEHQRIPLVARAAPDARRLYWYQDGLLVASNGPQEQIFLPSRPGLHRLVVSDDLGRSDGVTYRVE